MTDPINPTPTASKPHGNQLSEQKRVRLCGGPFIDTHTMGDLKGWQQRGTSYGVAIDRLVINANRTGFDPVANSSPATPGKTRTKTKK